MFVTIINTYLFPAFRYNRPFGINVKNSAESVVIEFNDFASHFNFVKSTLLQDRPSPGNASVYSLVNHLKVNSEWAGKNVSHTLSFGYSPTMLLVLAPMVFFPHATAYCLFNLFGLISVWWWTHPTRSRFGIVIIAFLNPVTFACFGLGQTAILTGAGLLYLYEKTRQASKIIQWHSLMLTATVLWALSSKPPLAVTASSVLIGMRTWRPVVLAILLTAFTTFAVSPLLGEGWWWDYLNLVTTYNKVQAAPEYAWSHHPELMTSLRGVLTVDFGIADNVSSKISSMVWIVTLAVIAAFAPLMRLTTGGLWSLGVLSYLAFCPHVSDTEEIQILLLIPFCVPPHDKKLRWQDMLLLVVVSLACFTAPARSIIFDNNRLLLFSIKIALMVFVTFCYQLREADRPTIPEQL